MKKRVLFSGIIFVAMCFSACGLTPEKQDGSMSTSNISSAGNSVKLLTSFYGMSDQTCTSTGCYEWASRPSGDSVITYIDYASKQKVYLCSQPNCNHSNESCPAWFSGPTGYIFSGANDTKLFGIQSNIVDGQVYQSLWSMGVDGTNRRTLYELKAGESFCDAVAGSSEKLYITVRDFEGNKKLLEIDIENKKANVILEYSGSDWLYGAFQDKLVILYYENESLSAGVFTYTTYSLESKEQQTIYQYEYNDNGEPEKGCIGRTDQEFLYLICPTGNHLADVSKINMITGQKETLCHSLPYYHVDNTFVAGFEDNRMIVTVTDVSNPDAVETKTLAVHCDTGEIQEITQIISYGSIEMSVPIVATLDTELLVISGYEKRQVTLYGVEGVPYSTEMDFPVYALISKESFWAGKTAYQEIADLT